ncbi:hypothetical protein C2S53_012589 [Perilla frutescens var. hirtella]|uniref:ascorbate ferrireductase (transmembrane) n=1 Tax=Perilla frutescens var. hirtella TaxID=608512 RepID=A0AAD4J9X9_PERFH|nr:hypothetical protein C2S53_012589 [Perilla frutescens var. hirtella]
MATNQYSSFRSSTAFPATMLAHLAAAALITLMLVWLLHFRGGLSFKSDDKAKYFNLHPLLMVIGFILISGEAIMAYKTVPATKKRQKQFHMILQMIALVAGILGIYVVFNYHTHSGIMHMYTLHSWLGIATISLFALHWLFSFFTFWYPGAQQSTKARLAPWHGVVGSIIFLMSILSAETGLIEKFIFLGLTRNQEALILNFTGVFIILFAVYVCFTVALSRYNQG